jgi:hypothetical protein
MRNSWKLWTAMGAGLLVVAGPSVSGAFAVDIPSPQQGTVLPMPAAPPNAFDPNPQGGDRSGTNHDVSGGPQSDGQLKHAEQQGNTDNPPATPNTKKSQPTTTKPNGQVPPSSMGNLPNRQRTPFQTPEQQQTPQKAEPNTPQDPKMPDGKDMNLPDVTAPQDGPGPVGPVGAPKGA